MKPSMHPPICRQAARRAQAQSIRGPARANESNDIINATHDKAYARQLPVKGIRYTLRGAHNTSCYTEPPYTVLKGLVYWYLSLRLKHRKL